MEKLRSESGQSLIFAALSMTVLLGFMALATDVGLLFRAKRNVQIAADAAATAGALDLSYGLSASTAAKAASAQNGVSDGASGTTVTVNSPPVNGPYAGTAGYVEVISSQSNATIFMNSFGFGSMAVAARAVAGTPSANNLCVYLTSSNASPALDLQGAYDLEAPGCAIYVNSSDPGAVNVTGNGGTVNAAALDVVGGATGKTTSPTAATTGVAAQSDPFGNIQGPTPASGCSGNTSSATTVSGSFTPAGGVICYTNAVTLSGATLGSGIYVFENGVTIGGTVTVNGGTLDIYSGTFTQPSNTTLNITAPTSGTYNGIALLQPASNTNNLQVQFGSSNQTLNGFIYAPGAYVYLQDNGGGVTATGVVASTMKIKSSTLRLPSYSVANPTTTPLRQISLVE